MLWKRRETMGGGHLSRPDFGMPQPDPDHPLTEFYLLLQHGLDKAGVFHLPALYASFRAPARRIYADEAAGCLTLSETADFANPSTHLFATPAENVPSAPTASLPRMSAWTVSTKACPK